MLLCPAHADDSIEISLHNDDTLQKLSVVTNWTLLCEQLCSLNLSGPACGPGCPSTGVPVVKPIESSEENIEEYNFPPEHRSELCETLCDNGLGGIRCWCPIKIVPASSNLPDRNNICADFCRYHLVTLRGCKRCLYDTAVKPLKPSKRPKPLKNDIPAPVNPHRMDLHVNFQDMQDMQVAPFDSSAEVRAQSTPPTTPDWTRLCATLCRQGNGGILCNCDLAPF